MPSHVHHGLATGQQEKLGLAWCEKLGLPCDSHLELQIKLQGLFPERTDQIRRLLSDVTTEVALELLQVGQAAVE